jgi:LacI family transcriptional regulator
MELLQMKDRENAYRDALLHNQIPYEEANILRTKYDVPKEKAVKEIRNFLKEKKFDAVVFATNYLGIYGLQSIKELKLKIPTDLRIICFDDHDIFELYTPGITVIEQPIRDMAKAAVNILINTLKHKKPAENSQILLPTNFIIRGSV